MKSKNKIKKNVEVKAKKENVIVVEKKKKRVPVAKKPPKVEAKPNAYKRTIEKKKLSKLEVDEN
jgi:hypothetical protein